MDDLFFQRKVVILTELIIYILLLLWDPIYVLAYNGSLHETNAFYKQL